MNNKTLRFFQNSLPAKALRKFMGYEFFTHYNAINSAFIPREGLNFLLRIDDFPNWRTPSENFLEFHEVVADNSIPYLLGVTPKLCIEPLNPSCNEFREWTGYETDMIKTVSKKADIAMHGVTHRTIKIGDKWLDYSEFAGLTENENQKKIDEGMRIFESIDIKPKVFLPPFNTFDETTLKVISRRFQCVTGGIETIQHMGFKKSPSYVNDMLYIPSYPPADGDITSVLRFVRDIKRKGFEGIIPLTLHRAAENDPNGIKLLCEELQENIVSWSEIIKEYSIVNKTEDRFTT